MFNKSDSQEELIDHIQQTIEDLLDKMGIVASAEYRENAVVQETERTPHPLLFDVDCANPGILIGRGGQTLESLQYIVRTMISSKLPADTAPIVIDVSGYKQRRYRFLKELAARIADQVAESGRAFTMEPMSAYERRIIHTALNDDTRVITESTGLAEGRKVVVKPADSAL